MSVIATNEWIRTNGHRPIHICEKLAEYFSDASATDIHQHLIAHGMYHQPTKQNDWLIKNEEEKNVWTIIQKEEILLKNKWKGPDIPIFILPTDPFNRRLRREHRGKSGLAFHDKLFLFISTEQEVKEIKALFTHEYNHVCRLANDEKSEEDYTLIDTMVLEGLAEYAVFRRFGKSYAASWISYYSTKQLKRLWKTLILPNSELPQEHPKHEAILYGLRMYPRMIGYCVGYYLVHNYMKTTDLSFIEVLKLPAKQIAQIDDS
ncbi:MAG TPA: DUF2268 domain-containing protein [Bacillota bacterium]|nr:DUF2268 domain-containing protein [Bacillota bacterium]